MEGEPEDEFDSIYIYTLVKYGISKPEPILNFFRNEHIREAFRQSYYTGDLTILDNEAAGIIDWNLETNRLGKIDYDSRNEFREFTRVFDEYVNHLMSPADAKLYLAIVEALKEVTEMKQMMVIENTYTPRIILEVQHVPDEREWVQSELVYQMDLPQELTEQNIEGFKSYNFTMENCYNLSFTTFWVSG